MSKKYILGSLTIILVPLSFPRSAWERQASAPRPRNVATQG